MKKVYSIIVLSLVGLFVCQVFDLQAGNDNRRGTAGFNELRINPWTRSAGWGSVNTANGTGLDALYTNVAGLSGTKRFEGLYDYTFMGSNTGVGINNGGLAYRLGDASVLALSLMAMNYKDESITKFESPENGDNAMFSPSMTTINVSYAHSFSLNIHGGATLKLISAGVTGASTMGFAIDAGIKYIGGNEDQFKFGVALKNIGIPAEFSGDAFTESMTQPDGYQKTMTYMTSSFELPTSLNIGASYDFLFEKNQRLTLAGNFTSEAFGRDKYALGAEYGFLNFFQVRAGYIYEDGLWGDERATFIGGPSAGLTIEAPLMKKTETKTTVPTIVIDYAFRYTYDLGGINMIGVGILL